MHFSLKLDHLVVTAATLEEGVNYVQAILGIELSPGGKHPHMGTHNMLLSLGPHEYLEVIAIDPDGGKPAQPRWFNLDNANGPPRMNNWVCNTDDLLDALDHAPPGAGEPMELERADMTWKMAVPPFGRLPFDDAMPALIEWPENAPRPQTRLPDLNLRLTRLDVFHPDSDDLLEAFPALHRLDHVSIRKGPEKRLIATISTPDGTRILA